MIHAVYSINLKDILRLTNLKKNSGFQRRLIFSEIYFHEINFCMDFIFRHTSFGKVVFEVNNVMHRFNFAVAKYVFFTSNVLMMNKDKALQKYESCNKSVNVICCSFILNLRYL